jgi:hypothetical protein
MSSKIPKMFRLTQPWATALIVSLGLIGAWLLWGTQPGRELNNMPAAERKELYSRTLETLRTTCKRSTGERLSDYCRDQAEFVLHFPECDATCQRVASEYAPQAVR